MEPAHLAYELLTEPGRASAEQGQVMLDGPNGTALTMTPEAAIGTAWSLIQAADAARRQIAGAGPDGAAEIGGNGA